MVVQDAVTRHDLPAGRFRPRRQTVDSLLGMTTPAIRLRLRDLADELGIDTAHATTLLRHACAGHAGRPPRKPFGPSTVVGQSLAARVRNLGRQPTTTVDNPPVGDRSPAVSSDTDPTTRETAASPGTLFQAPGARPVPAVVPAAHPSPPVSVVDRSLDVEPSPEPPNEHGEWARRGIEPVEQTEWVSAGLRPTESVLADHCRSAGIEPHHLDRRLSGQTALSRLRGGEPATSVWARIQEGEDRGRGPGRLQGRFA